MNWRMSAAPDWGNGRYELFAPALEASAANLVRIAAPQLGERAVDLGCGSGNATLPLAAAGAQVTAIDPSLRLLGIATERAREAGHRITSAVAGAEAIPLPAADADLVISNFGVIFAFDPTAAIREVMRILTPDGRFLFSAWQPRGAIADVARVMREAAVGSATPSPIRNPDGANVVLWHDPSTFAHLIPGGANAITVHEAETDFVAESADAWIQQQAESHPMWLAAREHLADDAVWRKVLAQSIEVLAAGSRETDQLRVASPYSVIEIHPRRR